MWRLGLAEYDDLEGIVWEWQSIDGAIVKSPMGIEAVGPNPTDRGKKWDKTKYSHRRAWNPSIDSRKRSEHTRCKNSGQNNGRSDFETT